MPDLAKRMELIAARVHAYAPDRLPPFGKPELRNLWRQATELGLAVQLHFEPRYAPAFEPLIKEIPRHARNYRSPGKTVSRNTE